MRSLNLLHFPAFLLILVAVQRGTALSYKKYLEILARFRSRKCQALRSFWDARVLMCVDEKWKYSPYLQRDLSVMNRDSFRI